MIFFILQAKSIIIIIAIIITYPFKILANFLLEKKQFIVEMEIN